MVHHLVSPKHLYRSLLLAAFVLPLCLLPSARADTIFDVISNKTQLSSLKDLGIQAGLKRSLLDNKGATLTMFAPTNQAISYLGSDYLEKLLSAPFSLHLKLFLLYHVTGAMAIRSDDFVSGQQLIMINGDTVTMEKVGTTITLSDSRTVAARLSDKVNETVAENGVVHIIDGVLKPNFMHFTILDLSQDPYGTTVEYFVRTGMDRMLKSDSYTLFAPTNLAWFNMGEWLLNELVNDIPRLSRLLERHVVPSVYIYDRFVGGIRYPTLLDGVDVMINKPDDESFLVDESNIILRDYLSSLSVTHGIDRVLDEPTSSAFMWASSTILGWSLFCVTFLLFC